MKESLYVLHSDLAGFDIGNTGANVAVLVIPVRSQVHNVLCYSTTAAANSFTVSLDSYDRTTQGAEDVGKIIVPDSAAAFKPYYDFVARGTVLNAGMQVLAQVDEAGDSGEKAVVQLVLEPLAEREDNESLITETA